MSSPLAIDWFPYAMTTIGVVIMGLLSIILFFFRAALARLEKLETCKVDVALCLERREACGKDTSVVRWPDMKSHSHTGLPADSNVISR